MHTLSTLDALPSGTGAPAEPLPMSAGIGGRQDLRRAPPAVGGRGQGRCGHPAVHGTVPTVS